MRNIPKYYDNEKNIKVYVEELLLGPRGMNLISVFPEATRLNQIMLREKKLFIDINNMVLETDISKSYNIGKSNKIVEEKYLF